MERRIMSHMVRVIAPMVFGLVFCLGCGSGSDFPVAAVSGTVTCDGKAVPSAWLYFEPLSGKGEGASALVGKQGFGIANEKGEFVITTYNPDDGAVIGNHKVHVLPPKSDVVPGFKCPCEFDSEKEPILVEVKKGKNDFKFTLPMKKAGSQTQSKPLTLDEKEALREAHQEELAAKANAKANAKPK